MTIPYDPAAVKTVFCQALLQTTDETTLQQVCPRPALATSTYTLNLCDVHAAAMEAQRGIYYRTSDGGTAWLDIPDDTAT